MEYKYNYVIAGGGGFYSVAYRDIVDLENVSYHEGYISKQYPSWVNLLFRINFNLLLNKYVKTPLKYFVYPRLYPHNFSKKKPICYIFFQKEFAVINSSYLEYIKKTDPEAKLVLYFQDLVSSLKYYNIEEYKKRFDFILSYDKKDCEKYNLYYCPTPYSKIDLVPSRNDQVDVYFCGAGKNRYQTILDVYRKCRQHDIKCKFIITGVPEERKIYGEGLIYDTPISYVDNLKNVINSKCILEVMQENAIGFTPRLWEAIFYGKHLLTNNEEVKNTDYYSSENIHFIKSGTNGFEWINNKAVYNQDLIRNNSPQKILDIIETIL